jgi:hypothetical protein
MEGLYYVLKHDRIVLDEALGLFYTLTMPRLLAVLQSSWVTCLRP